MPRKRKSPTEVLFERLSNAVRWTSTEFDLEKFEVLGVLAELIIGVSLEEITLGDLGDEVTDSDDEDDAAEDSK